MNIHSQKGFTLMELMITVAIIGILASIAYPAYQSSILRTNRVTASACLSEISQQMERYYTSNLSYTGAAIPGLTCINDVAARYTFAFAAAPTATAYQINATPTGAQTSDTQCATLNINQAGAKGITGTGTVASCWR